MAESRIYLLDAMALLYRAHFAFIARPIQTSTGLNTSAVYGFTTTLLDLLERCRPTHIAVAFDTPEPTPRHEWYPAYKAQRDAMPEDLVTAIPLVKRLLGAFRIPVLECPGFEADDIIGTIAHLAIAEPEAHVYMVTPDKDFAQLVTDRTVIYRPGRGGADYDTLDLAAIRQQWQVETPDQVVDILGLWGDASDNIPGIPGIGEKTAKKLIAEYGSVEGIIAAAPGLKGKLKENVEAHAEQALLSKKLARIILDAPVKEQLNDLVLQPRDDAALRSFCVELEMNSIGKRLYGDEFKAGRGFSIGLKPATDPAAAGEEAPKENDGPLIQGELFANIKTLETTPHRYALIAAEDAAGRKKWLDRLSREPRFCFDLETTGLDHRICSIVGLAVSCETGSGAFLAFPAEPEASRLLLEECRPIFENETIEKIGHNLKFDLSVLYWRGLEVRGPFFDTMLAHSLLDPDQRHDMNYLAEVFLGYTPVSIESLIGPKSAKTPQRNMRDVYELHPSKVADYAVEDADVTWQLAEIFREKLIEQNQTRVFHEIECPLLSVLVAMEAEGVRIDTAALDQIRVELEKRIRTQEAIIVREAGVDFNLNSPKQLGEVLFGRLHLLEKPAKTATGQFKTDEATLESLEGKHPIIRAILDYREATKLKSTYVDALPEAIFPATGRVHTTFHQLMTATGRLASSGPNLQNIPIRTEQGREIRRAFVPRSSEFLILAADYSQIELRVMASLSGDTAMIEAFQSGLDIHSATAARVFGVAVEDVIPDMRRTAKMVNFGIIYGISAFGLAKRLGIDRKEAARIIEEYFKQYPGVQRYMEETVTRARERGYVETMTGRRRYLRDINSRNGMTRSGAERTAINTPIQGSAADMIKIAMTRVQNALREGHYRSRLILQVHDELVFDLHLEEQDRLPSMVVDCMRDALPLSVPVVVDTGTGDNWLAAH